MILGAVLEMVLDHGRAISHSDMALHYVYVARGIVMERRIMEGGGWPSSVAIRPMVKRMRTEERAVGNVKYVMKVSVTGSVYHWMELT